MKKGKSMRKVMTLKQIRAECQEDSYLTEEEIRTAGICALVDVENMGFCKDGETKWYFFTNRDGEECVYFKQKAF